MKGHLKFMAINFACFLKFRSSGELHLFISSVILNTSRFRQLVLAKGENTPFTCLPYPNLLPHPNIMWIESPPSVSVHCQVFPSISSRPFFLLIFIHIRTLLNCTLSTSEFRQSTTFFIFGLIFVHCFWHWQTLVVLVVSS